MCTKTVEVKISKYFNFFFLVIFRGGKVWNSSGSLRFFFLNRFLGETVLRFPKGAGTFRTEQ